MWHTRTPQCGIFGIWTSAGRSSSIARGSQSWPSTSGQETTGSPTKLSGPLSRRWRSGSVACARHPPNPASQNQLAEHLSGIHASTCYDFLFSAWLRFLLCLSCERQKGTFVPSKMSFVQHKVLNAFGLLQTKSQSLVRFWRQLCGTSLLPESECLCLAFWTLARPLKWV